MKGDVSSTPTQEKDWQCTKMLTVVMELYIIFVFFFIFSIFSIVWQKKKPTIIRGKKRCCIQENRAFCFTMRIIKGFLFSLISCSYRHTSFEGDSLIYP